jgi:hypothetical protein
MLPAVAGKLMAVSVMKPSDSLAFPISRAPDHVIFQEIGLESWF